ncbi:MAG TPA: ParA family protein [Phycisphaerae bacterium]|nr:ParA family protein [Phycisphaerae bacterium]HRY67604.1 ParA family protein [Phycisphaerae bacterium]HSA24991.1 ParA family protein [Phycisphaerae bacterium]
MRRIAVLNQKGGVGKTTTTANVAAALARAGHRVLVIDLDPQSHLSLHLGVDPAANRPGTYELLAGSTSIAKCRVKVANNLWVVGSSIDLAAAEVELVSVVGREVILRDLLDQHVGLDRDPKTSKYDYVLIDCPPSLGVLTLNGLCAAQEVVIPLQPHYLALQGLSKLLETVLLVGRRINAGLKVGGVVICMYEAGTKLAAEVVDDVRSFLDSAKSGNMPWSSARLYKSVIRRNIKLAEAPSHGQSIFDYAPDSNGAKDYEELAAEIDGKVGGAGDPAPSGVVLPAADQKAKAGSVLSVASSGGIQPSRAAIAEQECAAGGPQAEVPEAAVPVVVVPSPVAPVTAGAAALSGAKTALAEPMHPDALAAEAAKPKRRPRRVRPGPVVKAEAIESAPSAGRSV